MDEFVPSEPPVGAGSHPSRQPVHTVAPGPAGPPHSSPPSIPAPVRLPRRRPWLSLILFLLTCGSTFFAGGTLSRLDDMDVVWTEFNAREGLIYMLGVMAILLAHEMGHFVQTVLHRVPASWPYFIPMPASPLGTMGAVIVMDLRIGRRQLFDIGLSGPLAGLVVAVPLAWYGVATAEPFHRAMIDGFVPENPLLMKWLIAYLRPELPADVVFAWNSYYMAAWVGFFITGLNMVPVSQLDGGHTAYALFGPPARYLGRGVALAALVYALVGEQYNWLVMLALVTMIGIDHTPTADDGVPLGWPRRVLGLVSLSIPILCFAPRLMR